MSEQIKYCQEKGKIVTISLGGADSEVGFSTDSQAQTFADYIWNMFLGGSEQNIQRPFGDAILDGYAGLSFSSISGLNADIASFPFLVVVVVIYILRVDLDIENGGRRGYAAFVNRLRERANNGTNKLFVSAAPQCVFPDAYIGKALNEAQFDAVYVQFCTSMLFVLSPG